MVSRLHRPKLLLLAPTHGNAIHGRRALTAALSTGFETVFVDWHDPKPDPSMKYRFVKLPQSRRHGYARVLNAATATRLDEKVFAWWFRSLWKQVAPDVVHVCWIDFRAALCARVGMSPLILSAWGSDINLHFEAGADPVRRAHTIEALSSASLTIVDARALVEKCEMLAGRHIPSEVLHLGVDTTLFRGGLNRERAEVRAQLKISGDAVLISSMRALSALYNHDLILEAFASALPQLRKKTYLLFKKFNAHSAYLDMLQCKTRDYGITDRVLFIDEVPQAALPSLYAATDFVINCPRQDGFPVTLLEAAACQRAVICNRLETYCGMIPDENITWVPENDPVALTAAIIEKTNGYEYHDESFLRVREAVISGFSDLRYRERLRALYCRVAHQD
jgi:glycosyltransferase involved in cell wall biosynthesis